MMLGMGAAVSALEGLFGLISPKQTQATGSGREHANLFAFQADAPTGAMGPNAGPAAGRHAPLSPETMAALLAAQSQLRANFTPMSRGEALKDLFARIDADGDGKITNSEFQNSLGAGGTNLDQANSVFGKLDRDGDGSVSLGEMASALMRRHREHRHARDQSGDLLQAPDSATGSSANIDDLNVTTTKATSSASTAATSSYNLLEQLIQRHAKPAKASSSLSLSI